MKNSNPILVADIDKKDQCEFKQKLKKVPINILGFYSINDVIFRYQAPIFIFIRCDFDVLQYIEKTSMWECFFSKLTYQEKTRDILYQIANSITRNDRNPRKAYGTSLQDVLKELKKATLNRKIVILAREIDSEIIPRIAGLDLTIRIIAQPLRGWKNISKLSKNGLCRIVTLNNSAHMQECFLRSFVAENSDGKVLNPWGNLAPQALVQILAESDRNLLLFVRIMKEVTEYEFISAKNVARIIDKAWEIHLREDITAHEWYVLKNLPSYPSKDDLKEACHKISKTEFEHLFKNLLSRGIIRRSRSYTSKGKRHIIYYLTSRIAEFLGAIS